MKKDNILQALVKDPYHKIIHIEVEEPVDFEYGRTIEELNIKKEIKLVLKNRSIHRLYKFQEEAIDLILKGKSVFISAGTGTGKTEAFLIPLAEKILDNPYTGVQVLLVYPTKALARDQFKRINEFFSMFFGIRAAIYDGDVSEKERKQIFNFPPQILITNPDMIHVSLIYSPEFKKLLPSIRFVVLDDMHVYSGVFGTHVAYVIRRLKRTIGHPIQCIGTSATLENPEEFAFKIFGEKIEIIKAPRGRKGRLVHILVKPSERSKRMEVISLLRLCLNNDLKTLVFVDSHRIAELLKYMVDKYGLKVKVHRAGFKPEVRRKIELDFKSGRLKAVIATPTLELGIDIGDLDAIILYSLPPTFSKYIQRTGRAGRRGQTAYIFTILGEDPISSYYERHPQEFFKQRVDPVFIDLENEEIAKIHLLAMAAESPVYKRDLGEFEREILKLLEEKKFVKVDNVVVTLPRGLRFLRSKLSIRGIGDIVRIVTKNGKTIGFREMPMALKELHPGAVYLHGGTPYLSVKFERKKAIVAMLPRGYDFITFPLYYTMPEELKYFEKTIVKGIEVKYLSLALNENVYGYVIKRFPSMQLIEEKMLDKEYSYSFKTKGLLLTFPVQSNWNELENAEAFHAIEHAIISAAQMVVGAASTDLGGVSFPSGHIYIYDSYPGGSGISKILLKRLERVLWKAFDVVSNCNCLDGCPKCIFSPYCGNNNKVLSRTKASQILREILTEKVKVKLSQRFGKPIV